MNPLIQRLLQPEAYPHPTGTIALRETHSAWVLLTGPYAYKLRKPVNFGFLDYSTAEKRRFCAQEELRLNRRLAPDLYLDLVELQGPPQQARFGGSEPGIELAVRMRQFDDQQLLSRAVEHGEISPDAIEALADELARFQSAAAVAPANGAWGTPAAVVAPVQSNLSALANAKALQSELAELQEWVNQSTKNLEPFFWQRLRSGRIREGHGDLHLGNMFLENGRIRVFDCLEFNPDLRWVDTISEMAFLVMDLESRGHESLALHLLNHWLDLVGDWQGLVAWRWYSAYRALVRAKVAELRRAQAQAEAPSDPAGSTQAREERDRYIAQALSWCRPHRQAVLITCGLSGSGKSWMSGQIAGAIGALRLRSDVERKRLFGLWGEPRRASRSGDLYRREVSDELFGRILPEQAKAVLAEIGRAHV